MALIRMTAKETVAHVRRESARIRAMAKRVGLTLHKAKRGFSFGFELRNEDGERVFGDMFQGYCRTLPQIEKFLAEMKTTPPAN